jgi:hypothetical protein
MLRGKIEQSIKNPLPSPHILKYEGKGGIRVMLENLGNYWRFKT